MGFSLKSKTFSCILFVIIVLVTTMDPHLCFFQRIGFVKFEFFLLPSWDFLGQMLARDVVSMAIPPALSVISDLRPKTTNP